MNAGRDYDMPPHKWDSDTEQLLGFKHSLTAHVDEDLDTVEMGIRRSEFMQKAQPVPVGTEQEAMAAARKAYREVVYRQSCEAGGKEHQRPIEEVAMQSAEFRLRETHPNLSRALRPEGEDIVWELLGFVACKLGNTRIPPGVTASLEMVYESSHSGNVSVVIILSGDEMFLELDAELEGTAAKLEEHQEDIVRRLRHVNYRSRDFKV